MSLRYHIFPAGFLRLRDRGGCFELIAAFVVSLHSGLFYRRFKVQRYWSFRSHDSPRLEDSRATSTAPPSRTPRPALIGGKHQQIRASFCSCPRDGLASLGTKQFHTFILRDGITHISAINMAPKDYMAEKGKLWNSLLAHIYH